MTAAAIAAAVFICLYALLDPAAYPFPKCPLKMLTGYDCPGCGSQRAIHALLTGRPADAWHYNALMVAALPLVGLTVAAEVLRRRKPALYRRVNSSVVIWAWLVVVVGWWIVRNV